VHRIADAHGGRVEVSNAADGGAVVELLLPEPPGESVIDPSAPAPPGARKEANHAHRSRG